MMLFHRSFICGAIVAAALGCMGWAHADTSRAADAYTPTVGQSGKDVVWVPTSQSLVDRMLDMAQLTPQDRLVDLGSGDGRTVITAAKRGATARGIEFNPDLVALSKRQAELEGVSQRASFEHGDIFESDFSDATVVTLFLLPRLNIKLRPILLDMAPGTRVIANSFDMGDWQPDETIEITEDCTIYCNAFKWIVPAKVAGAWDMDGKTLELKQKFQMFEGSLRDGATTQPVSNGRLQGAQLSFTIGSDQYTGKVDGGMMQGAVNGSRSWQAKRAAAR